MSGILVYGEAEGGVVKEEARAGARDWVGMRLPGDASTGERIAASQGNTDL